MQRSQLTKETVPTEADVSRMFISISEKLEILTSLKGTVEGIEQSVQMMSEQYDEIMKQLACQNADIKNLKARVERIEEAKYEDEISQLKDEMNELEWRSRRLNLEFHGIPQTNNENLLQQLNQVAAKISVPELTESDIVSAHRLPSKPGKIPGIIVRFGKQQTRDQWLEKKKELKRDQETIFIQENMTRHNRALLHAARDWASTRRYQYVWHKDGKILIREKEGGRAIVVKNINDLPRIR